MKITWVNQVSGDGHPEAPSFPIIVKSATVTDSEVRIVYEVNGA